MREMTSDDLKIVQMDILSAVDEFCSDNGINYSIAGGTFIGAIRHKGFIPWDDDIDIFMRRDEYNRFVQLFPDNYQGKYQLMCLEKNPKYCFTYANVCDVRTKVIENANVDETSVNVDLFPIDDVPDNDSDWLKYKRKLKIMFGLKGMKVIRFDRDRSAFKNVFLAIMKLLLLPFSLNFFVHRCDKLAQSCNGKGYTWVHENCFGVYGRYPFHKSVFDEFEYYQFEDRKFKGYKDYDDYLRNTFGDYLNPPPVEQQVSHHLFKASWKD